MSFNAKRRWMGSGLFAEINGAHAALTEHRQNSIRLDAFRWSIGRQLLGKGLQ